MRSMCCRYQGDLLPSMCHATNVLITLETCASVLHAAQGSYGRRVRPTELTAIQRARICTYGTDADALGVFVLGADVVLHELEGALAQPRDVVGLVQAQRL